MGSSDSGGGNGLPDSSIGSIVWVRRRNGSWWPGKILGTDELSVSHLMSPRSGTPVKLLGREDASVDWYNLEKSKRVKAFRCGDFDDCIERAEASLGLPSKKREKYARREDAILHALELEKELLEKGYGKTGAKSSTKNNSCGSSGKDLCTSSGALRNGNVRYDSTELLQYHKMGVSLDNDECNSNPLSAQKGEDGAWQSSVKSEYNPLIGSSQEITLPKINGSSALSPTHKATNDDQAQVISAGGVCLGSNSGVDSGNSTDKGRGPLDGSVEECSIRRRDRCRPLVQVLQNSSMWTGQSLQPEDDALLMSGVSHLGDDAQVKRQKLLYLPSQVTDIGDVKGDSFGQMKILASNQRVHNHSHVDMYAKHATPGSSEDTESDSDSSETDSLEHYVDVDMNTFSDVNTPMAVQSRALNSLEVQGDEASTSSDESDESSHHITPHFHGRDPVPLDMGVSRWKLKGKRNIRSFSRKSLDKFAYGTFLEPRSLVQRPSPNLSYYHDHDGYNNEVDFIEDDPINLEGYGNRGHMWKSEATPRRWNIPSSNMMDWDDQTWRDSSLRGYRGDVFSRFNSRYGGLHHGQELLFDVDLKVQAYHRRERVPFVSLMSRLNGKPIIGHPIQVETLGDGSTHVFVSSSDAFENFECDDGNRVPSAWTTARRTSSFRVPRPHLSSYLDDANNQLIDQDKKSQPRSLAAGNSHAKKKNSARRKSSHVARNLSSDRKKPPKKSSSSSSQKIRPLSSIGMDQNHVSEPRHSGLIGYMDGVIKPLDSGPPIVACIPVKLVFSRLLEAIGRPPSMSSSHKGFGEQ